VTIEDFTPEQINRALESLEGYYRTGTGDVDLIKMSNDQPGLFDTWRRLRERARVYAKENKSCKSGKR
jgi:hypothetical protein